MSDFFSDEYNEDDWDEPDNSEKMDDYFKQNPQGFPEDGLRPVSFIVAEAILLLRAWQKQDRSTGGFRAALAAVDKYMTFAPKEVTIIGARPGMGKTALAMQLVRDAAVAENNERVAFFSADMSGAMLTMRMAIAIAEVNIPTLRRGRAKAEQYSDVELALRALSQMPIWIADKSAPDFGFMRDQLLSFVKEYKLTAVVFDFMELMQTKGRATEERASLAVTELKMIAKEFSVPVIILSQLNRDVESRPDKMPRLSDLRASGMLEQLADQVILMMRPKYYQARGMEVDTKRIDKILGPTNVDDPTYLIIAKNRNGETGTERVAYDARAMTFMDLQRTPLVEGESVEPPLDMDDDDDDDPATLSRSLGLEK